MPRVACLLLPLCVLAATGILQAQNTKENADFKLAINLYNDGLYDLAEEQLKQFIGSYPNTSQGIDARFTLGLTELKLKKYESGKFGTEKVLMDMAARREIEKAAKPHVGL